MKEKDIVIVGATRTAIGDFGGTLKEVPPIDLAQHVIKEVVARAKTQPDKINKVIFGDDTTAAIERRRDPRQVFAAGDSDTDIEFLRDSTFKLAINRNKKEIMCFAYHNEGNRWLVNPMFLEPRARQAALYPCSTTACKAADGTPGPCLDEAGAVIPDQADTVY